MINFFKIFKQEHAIYKIITILILIATFFFLYRVIKNTIVGIDFPNEILEPANINLTDSILSGNVPYDFDNVVTDGAEPPINYEYPFLNSIFAAGLSFVVGGNTVVAHYILSFMAMMGTAVLGGILVFRYSRTTVGPTMVFILLMFCHWRYGYISAAPDGLGLFITISILFLASSSEEPSNEINVHKEKNNVFRKDEIAFKPFICALLTVAVFYTKQYYAGVCVSIFLYFWIISKKNAIRYFVWCVVLLVMTIVVINWKWPLYWCYSVLNLYHGTFKGWDLNGLLVIINQIKYLSAIFIGMVIVLVVALILRIRQNRKSNVSSKNKNLSDGTPLVLFLIQIPVQLFILFVIGRNDGAYLSYFLQLLMPSVIISTIILMEQMKFHKNEFMFMGIYGFLVLFTVYFGWNKLPMHMYTEEDVLTWQRAYAILDEYREKGPILHCNSTVFNGYKNGDSVVCTSHDGDVRYDNYEDWKNSEFLRLIFPYANYMYEENFNYWDTLRECINKKQISMITLYGWGTMYTNADELTEAGYHLVDIIDLQVGNMTYATEFWAAE